MKLAANGVLSESLNGYTNPFSSHDYVALMLCNVLPARITSICPVSTLLYLPNHREGMAGHVLLVRESTKIE